MNFENKVEETAYYQEWAYVQGRTFLLTLLALGSLLITFKIGSYIGGLVFLENQMGQLTIQMFFVLLGYLGIDWVLANALASASNVDAKGKDKNKKSAWVFAVVALLTTVGLSVASNVLISSDMAGESHLSDFNNQIKGAMANDSLMKTKAFSLLEDLGNNKTRLVKEAQEEKRFLVRKAVLSGSENWQKEYRSAKNNRKAWFWVCTSCPSKFKRYRRVILKAMEEGDSD